MDVRKAALDTLQGLGTAAQPLAPDVIVLVGNQTGSTACRFSLEAATPCIVINAISVTTVAPAPPDIMPGLPPKIAVTKPMINAAYSPVKGERPASIANDKDSGIIVIATVNPAKTSTLKLILPCGFKYPSIALIDFFLQKYTSTCRYLCILYSF
jgi:hypothetical protein